jgi:vitamin B12 transporter
MSGDVRANRFSRERCLALTVLFGAGVVCTAQAADDGNTPGDDAESTLREVVVTARRAEASQETTPQRIEVISRREIENTPAREFVDLLKKNSSVDVVQYPGNTSGIGIRGFRPDVPEYSGVAKHSLLLIDGRPAMTNNLSLVNMDQIERVEVLKGPASALYGSSAMGGVINIITRQSTGKLSGFGELGYGSYDTREARVGVGGALLEERFDFDYSGSYFKQNDDLKMGDGKIRPNTDYGLQNHALRLGWNITRDWRLNFNGDIYRGRDIAVPGSLASGTSGQSNKDVDRHGVDLLLTGNLGAHQLKARIFGGKEAYDSYTKTSSVASYQPYLPFLSYGAEIKSKGWQIQDQWTWSDWGMSVFGVDRDQGNYKTFSYNPDGTRRAPSSAYSERESLGVFIQNSLFFNDGNTVIDFGVRHDSITTRILDTPLKTNYTTGSADFSTVNPSLGFRQRVGNGGSLHGTIGKGFVPPSAPELTGSAITVRALPNKNDVISGNPGLNPESSVTWDLGFGWTGGAWQTDVTYFNTRVKDKITRVNVGEDADNLYFSYRNANSARMRGIEIEGQWQAARWLSFSLSGTWYLKAEEILSGTRQDIRNIPKHVLRLAAELRQGPWNAHLGVRKVGDWKDNDWEINSANIITEPGFTLVDLSLAYTIDPRQTVTFQADNLFDRYYAEKGGYPLAGRSFKLRYRYQF